MEQSIINLNNTLGEILVAIKELDFTLGYVVAELRNMQESNGKR